MQHITKRICAALTGLTVLMTGMCVPQFAAAAADNADLVSEAQADRILLKTVSGTLSAGGLSQEFTLSRSELNGNTFTRIDAVVEFVPDQTAVGAAGLKAPAFISVFTARNSDLLSADPADGTLLYLSDNAADGMIFNSFDRNEIPIGDFGYDTLNLQLLFLGEKNDDGQYSPVIPGTFSLKLYGSTEEETYHYPTVLPLSCSEKKILKEVCGDLSAPQESDIALSLTYDELNGKTYDAIYAEVFFTPEEASAVPEDRYRFASHTMCGYSIQTYADADSVTDEGTPVSTGSLIAEKHTNGTYPLISSPGTYQDAYATFEVCSGLSQNESLKFYLPEMVKTVREYYYPSPNEAQDAEPNPAEKAWPVAHEYYNDVPMGLYAVRLIGYKFTSNDMPSDACLSLLGEAECELSADAKTAAFTLPIDLFQNKFYTDFYVTAEYSSQAGSGTPFYAQLNMIGDRSVSYSDDPVLQPDGTSSTTHYTNNDSDHAMHHVPVNLPNNGTSFTAMAAGTDFYRMDPADLREKEITGDVRISCDLYKDFAGTEPVTGGTVRLRVYGYDPYDFPPAADMHEILSTQGRFAAAEEVALILTEEDCYSDYYIMVEGTASNKGKANIELQRDAAKVLPGSDHSGMLPLLQLMRDLYLFGGFGAMNLQWKELDHVPQPGDKILLNGFLYNSDGSVPNSGFCKVTLYGVNSAAVSTRAGDVNCDGSVDVSDAVLLARFIAEDSSASVTADGKSNADVNRSGNPDPDDIVLILRYIARLITAF